jgi:hypothetical protein
MNAFGLEDWFVVYVGWCAGLIVSNGLGLGMLALVAGAIGYYCFLKLANHFFQTDAGQPVVDTRKALRVLLRAAR